MRRDLVTLRVSLISMRRARLARASRTSYRIAMEAESTCPYCGEPVSLWIDEGGGGSQSYVEDCSVCCRPWSVTATIDEEGEIFVALDRLDD